MGFSSESELDLENRAVTPDYNLEGVEVENPPHPRRLSGYIGQQKVRGNLAVFVETTKQRKETLDHVLLYGPPGLGKTTLASIIANEMGAGVRIISDPAIEEPDDLAAILTNPSPGNAPFTDEIHRLPRSVEEILYPAMEDLTLDIIIERGQMATSYHLPLSPFMLVGTTTRAGRLSAPLCDHLGVVLRLELYLPEKLAQIAIRSAGILGTPIKPEGTLELASHSRGIPRITNRLLRCVRDFAQVISDGAIMVQAAQRVLERLKVGEVGLDADDRRMLRTIIEYHRGDPVGLDTLAAAIGEESVTLENVYEPCLIQIDLLSRTPHGRCATRPAYLCLGLTPPEDLTGTQ